MTHGGDMAVTRIFDVSAIRQGFIIDIEQSYYSEVFSLYGFYFELIAEKISDHKFQFHIQVKWAFYDFKRFVMVLFIFILINCFKFSV